MKTLGFLTALLIASSSGQFSAEELTGDWASDCTPLGGHSVLATLSFSEEAVATVVEMFSDSSCQLLNLRGEYDALFSVGRRVAAGREIDFTPTRVTMTIHNPEVVAAYRQNEGGCGIRDWQIGEPRDVSGRFCAPYQMPTVGTAIYDVYTAGSGELRFGGFPDQIGATQPGDRPVSLSGLFRFVRTHAQF